MNKTRPASLRRWRPRSWNREEEVFETFDTTAAIADPPILVELSDLPENRDLVTLYRAAERNGLADRLFHQAPVTEATPWHDGLERIVAMRIEYRLDGETVTLACPRNDGFENWNNHASVDAIAVHVVLHRGRDGDDRRTLKLPTDFAVSGEYGDDPATTGVLVGAGSKLDIDELSVLIHDAVFEPGGDEDDDSFETQLEDSRENAYHAACELLLDKTAARNEKIRYSIRHRVGHLAPEGHTVRITKHPGVEAVEVDVAKNA